MHDTTRSTIRNRLIALTVALVAALALVAGPGGSSASAQPRETEASGFACFISHLYEGGTGMMASGGYYLVVWYEVDENGNRKVVDVDLYKCVDGKWIQIFRPAVIREKKRTLPAKTRTSQPASRKELTRPWGGGQRG